MNRSALAYNLRRVAQALRAENLQGAAKEVGKVAAEIAPPTSLGDLIPYFQVTGGTTVTINDPSGMNAPVTIPIDEAVKRTDASDKQIPVTPAKGGWFALVGGKQVLLSSDATPAPVVEVEETEDVPSTVERAVPINASPKEKEPVEPEEKL